MKQKPIVHSEKVGKSNLVRFSTLDDIYWYDEQANNPNGIGIRGTGMGIDARAIQTYKQERLILTPYKFNLIQKAEKQLSMDPEFLQLIYKGKTDKRTFNLNRFTGNLSMVEYSRGNDKMFRKGIPGAKKSTLDIAFQVGTFLGGNYEESFISILKTVLMCQAMNIRLNIDVFDSDNSGINNRDAYVICNICNSSERLNFRNLLAFSHQEFFHYTLFNGYSGHKDAQQTDISGFLSQKQIVKELGPMYDVIGGNMVPNKEESEGSKDMINKILKISQVNKFAEDDDYDDDYDEDDDDDECPWDD